MKAAALNQEIVLLVLLSGILTFLPVIFPVEGLVATALIPMPLIVLAVQYPWWYALGAVGVEAGILWLVGDGPAGFFFSQYVVIALAMAWAIRRSASPAQVIAASVMAPLVVGGCLLVGYSLVTRQSLGLLVTRYVDQLLHAIRDQLQALELLPGNPADTAADSSAQGLSQLMLTIVPALVIMNHLFTNVFNYVVARYYCARGHPSRAFDALRLLHWRAWEPLVWVFLASGTALVLPWPAVSAFGLNVFLLTLAVYFIQGVVILGFWGQRVPLPAGVRWVLGVMLFVMTGPLGWVGCIAIGLFDLWVDFRRLRRTPLAS